VISKVSVFASMQVYRENEAALGRDRLSVALLLVFVESANKLPVCLTHLHITFYFASLIGTANNSVLIIIFIEQV